MLSFCWWRLGWARWLSMWRDPPTRVVGKQRLLPRRTRRCAVHLACRDERRHALPAARPMQGRNANTRCRRCAPLPRRTTVRSPSARAIVRPVTLERSYLLPFDSHHSAAGAKRPVSHADGTGRTVNGWAGQRLGVTKPQPANAPATSARRRGWRRPRGRRAECPRRAAPGHRAGRHTG